MAKAIKVNKELILSGNMYKAIMSIAVPVMINSFLQTMYNLTDTYWLGKLGTDELAAINLVTPMQNIVLNFGSGITVAGSVLIAQYLGARLVEEAKKMATQIFACAMIFAFSCMIIFGLSTPFIVKWLGATGDVYDYGKTYLQLVFLDMPFLFCINIYSSVHQAQGDAFRPMLLNFSGIVINMFLDPLLMVILGWGVAGAALATVFSKAVPAVVAFVLLKDSRREIHLDLKHLKFERDKMRAIVTVGLPTALGSSFMQVGFLLMTRNCLTYGNAAMAAYGIGNKINGLISLPANGMGSAVSTIVAQNVGAKQYDRAEKSYRLSCRMIVVFLAIGGYILSRRPICEALAGIFSDETEVIMMAADYLSILALFTFTNGVQTTTMGLFQGSGHTEVTMAMDVIRLWVFRFATLYVCEEILKLGVNSIWWSVVVSNALSPMLLYIIYRTGYWKRKRGKSD
ncbi:MAG: MATE family efflux transporter [Lachnospiraceae bacterium]|nr:MATE family efflux transporter [Lachnospiraceae bacterium]